MGTYMGINKGNPVSGYPFFRYEAYCSNVMCEPKKFASRCNDISLMFILFDCY